MSEPLMGIVSRFTSQKGADLIAEIADRLAQEDVRLVALGTGDAEYEELFAKMAADYPDRIAVRIGFDNAAGAQDRGGRGHVSHAQPVRALRAESDLQFEIRNCADRARDRRA